jgi:hypothetical protein
MSPFLPTLFTVAMVEIGGATAQFSGTLMAGKVAERSVLRALGIISAGVMALAAIGASSMSAVEDIIPQVKTLLLGMALIWSSIGQFRVLKPAAAVEGDNPNVIALRGYARLAMTGSAGFLAFVWGVIGGGSADAVIEAALGGWIGIMIANVPPIFLTRRQIRKLHISWLRIIAGTLLALSGFIYALSALKLLG